MQDNIEVQHRHVIQDLMNLGQYHIPLEDLEIDNTSVIGSGGFGRVVRGELSVYPSVVAVKWLRSDGTRTCRKKTYSRDEGVVDATVSQHPPLDWVLLERELETGTGRVPNPA
ncbi:hypothetical protein FRB94_009505 [Tulasnella sp. JGI-2019a]|nr:hypothetical protein FRB94_009505 [Tulasnella sp. JGI-2019a]KAG9003146.1 hypothetical protein FRB93_011226 [Tulasnella sp. JGI-2019a]